MDVEKFASRRRFAGCVFALILGIIGLVGAFSQGSVHVYYLVVGVILVLVGVWAVPLGAEVLRRRTKLVVDAQGLQQLNPGGLSWSVPWQEVAAIAITYRHMRSFTICAGLKGSKEGVALEFLPRDSDFGDRHREFARRYWVSQQVGGYYSVDVDSLTNVFNGVRRHLVTPLNKALLHVAPALYHGFTLEGSLGWRGA
jgi:hypothetical protein